MRRTRRPAAKIFHDCRYRKQPQDGGKECKRGAVEAYLPGRGGALVSDLCPTPATLWMAAPQAPLSMGFSRQEHRSGLPLPYPGDLPHPGTELTFLVSLALAGRFFTTEPPGKPRVTDSFS